MKRYFAYASALLLALVLALGAQAQERTGAWVDEVVAVEEPSADAAVLQLELGGLDIYSFAISDPEIARRIEASPNLVGWRSFGSYSELSFNPVGPEFADGRLNPFAVPRVREAMNWLIDRDFIVQEIHGGLAVPKFFPITAAFPDYARMVDVARALEARYAHNPELAREVITQEMEALGAQLTGGRWHYNGQPVEIIVLIRTEDERLEIGDYVASLLEDIGFTVTRDYRPAAEASPIWFSGNPADGRFHIYTGGWVTTTVSRDQAGNFDFFYTDRGLASPLWQAYEPSPEFDEVARRLDQSDFRSLEERRELFARAMELALEDSVRLWLIDRLAVTPYRADVAVTADLAGAVYGSWLWAFTVRKIGQEGGTINIAMPSMLTEPWNPIGGSNWIYDQMMIRATSEMGTLPDPYTGLAWPQRIERAEVTVEEGLPVGASLDWVTLDFAPEIQVPSDAWIDWDASEQRFITVGEKHPDGLTALRRTVVYYPADLYETVAYHDGSPFSLADIVMRIILTFDRAKEESAIFDQAYVPSFTSFQEQFRGVRIVQENPLIIETYSDVWFLDAELAVSEIFTLATWWPQYGFGPGAWHNLAVGILAEAEQELAFTQSKSDRLGVDRMNFIAGPSIAILDRYLAQAAADNFIPYAPTLGQYISAAEAEARRRNLQAWRNDKGHFWLGTGPFYLERAFPIERTVQLRHNEAFPDLATKWERFEEPRLAEVDIDGPGFVTIGEAVEFEVFISFRDEAYAIDDVSEVKYLLFNAEGELAFTGAAEAVADGLWRIALSAEETAQLPEGANRLEVAVAPLIVSIPTFESVEFVTAQ
jgi:peptide/nickel transport system substrate-binding protein